MRLLKYLLRLKLGLGIIATIVGLAAFAWELEYGFLPARLDFWRNRPWSVLARLENIDSASPSVHLFRVRALREIRESESQLARRSRNSGRHCQLSSPAYMKEDDDDLLKRALGQANPDLAWALFLAHADDYFQITFPCIGRFAKGEAHVFQQFLDHYEVAYPFLGAGLRFETLAEVVDGFHISNFEGKRTFLRMAVEQFGNLATAEDIAPLFKRWATVLEVVISTSRDAAERLRAGDELLSLTSEWGPRLTEHLRGEQLRSIHSIYATDSYHSCVQRRLSLSPTRFLWLCVVDTVALMEESLLNIEAAELMGRAAERLLARDFNGARPLLDAAETIQPGASLLYFSDTTRRFGLARRSISRGGPSSVTVRSRQTQEAITFALAPLRLGSTDLVEVMLKASVSVSEALTCMQMRDGCANLLTEANIIAR